jgi:hypothetical protein
MHCYQGEHIWCWYGPGHWFLTSQLRYHHNRCGHGDLAAVGSRRHHQPCRSRHHEAPVALTGHYMGHGWHRCDHHHAVRPSDAL